MGKSIIKEAIRQNPLIRDIRKRIKKASCIYILGHLEPDGDCIGAQLALREGLESIGKKAFALNTGPFQGIMQQYKEAFSRKEDNECDLYIIVDTSDKDRIGYNYKMIDYSKAVQIDHHPSNENFARINWVNTGFISVSEMVYLLLTAMKISITPRMAQLLLFGVVYDNGYFQHIRREKYFSLFVTYQLMELGADSKQIYDFLYCNENLASEKLLGTVLQRITEYKESGILWTYITEKDKHAYQGEINTAKVYKEMLSIQKTRVCLFFKVNETTREISISFRSLDSIDISVIAARLGGGGHKVAAGAKVKGDFESIKDDLLEQIFQYINQTPAGAQ